MRQLLCRDGAGFDRGIKLNETKNKGHTVLDAKLGTWFLIIHPQIYPLVPSTLLIIFSGVCMSVLQVHHCIIGYGLEIQIDR